MSAAERRFTAFEHLLVLVAVGALVGLTFTFGMAVGHKQGVASVAAEEHMACAPIGKLGSRFVWSCVGPEFPLSERKPEPERELHPPRWRDKPGA